MSQKTIYINKKLSQIHTFYKLDKIAANRSEETLFGKDGSEVNTEIIVLYSINSWIVNLLFIWFYTDLNEFRAMLINWIF